MKKQLVYATDSYYYQTDEGAWEYDNFNSEEDYDYLVNTLDDEKYKTEARRFAKVKIDANLGLWDGRRHGVAEEDDFHDAIERCLGRDIQDFEIYQAGKWTIYIDAHHHDGTNHFKLTCYI